MRPHLNPAQLSQIQKKYETSVHVPEITFTTALAHLHPNLLKQSVTELLFQPGELIYQEGDPAEAAYIIRSGSVAVLKGDLNAPTVLGFRGPSELIGEVALIDNQARYTSLAAVRITRLLRIKPDWFRQLLAEEPVASSSLLRNLAGHLHETENALAVIASRGEDVSSEVIHLRAEKERLLELQRMREEMSDLVVHDLRIPLGNITNAIALLQMVLPAEILAEQREVLEIAEGNAQRLTRMAESLLEMSRLESGEITLNRKTIDLIGLIDAAIEQVNLLLQGRARIEQRLAACLPDVRGDRDMLSRVLVNLLDNALKHSPQGGVITIYAEPHRTEVVIAVNDGGPGIPPDQRERVFERFARLGTDKVSRAGFGLGLVFCRLAVELHGGKIWVEDGENESGSKFVFSLPIPES